MKGNLHINDTGELVDFGWVFDTSGCRPFQCFSEFIRIDFVVVIAKNVSINTQYNMHNMFSAISEIVWNSILLLGQNSFNET